MKVNIKSWLVAISSSRKLNVYQWFRLLRNYLFLMVVGGTSQKGDLVSTVAISTTD